MTSPRRFERDLPELLADLYVGGLPDYRDDLVRQTAATRQRPAWTFPERWLPMDLTMRRPPFAVVPWRLIGVALLAVALIAAALFVGSQQRRVPPPFGPARNGSIIFSKNGDLFTRDTASGVSRLILGGAEVDTEPGYSPDGLQLAFLRAAANQSYLTVSDGDGSHVRRVLDAPLDQNSWAQWAPDSRHLGVVTLYDGRNRFVLASTDGQPAAVAQIGDLVPIDFQFRPPDGREVAVRALDHGIVDIYLMNADGSNLRKLGLQEASDAGFGWQMDLHGISWSPTGDRMAYNVVSPDPYRPDHPNRLRVHVLTIATKQDVELPAPDLPDLQQAWASWSPDGTQILVQRFNWDKGWLGVLPSDGSTSGRDLGTPYGGEDSEMDQGWSPDGRTVLLRFNDAHFYAIDVATGAETTLTWPVDKIPDWQRLAP